MVKTKVIQPGVVTRSRAMQRTPVTSNLPSLNPAGGVIRKKILFDAREVQSDQETDPLELLKQDWEERKRSYIDEVPSGTWSPLKTPEKVETPKSGEKKTDSSVKNNSSEVKEKPKDVVSIDSESDGDEKHKKKKRDKNADGSVKNSEDRSAGGSRKKENRENRLNDDQDSSDDDDQDDDRHESGSDPPPSPSSSDDESEEVCTTVSEDDATAGGSETELQVLQDPPDAGDGNRSIGEGSRLKEPTDGGDGDNTASAAASESVRYKGTSSFCKVDNQALTRDEPKNDAGGAAPVKAATLVVMRK
jgi:hypothetical protein